MVPMHAWAPSTHACTHNTHNTCSVAHIPVVFVDRRT